MKILIVGAGSIGSRHLTNLHQLGHEVYAVDINDENLKKVSPLAKETFTSLDRALEVAPDAAFICTYSNGHILPARRCAEAGCHLFIEKPLSLDLNGIDALIEATDRKKLITMVGCNMRFHPAISYIQGVLARDPAFAKKLWANLEFGYYLPFAKKEYQTSYMANKNMGGNLIFDDIHELDYAVWFLGAPDEIICTKGIVSGLKIDTEDCVDMIIKFRSGVVATIHMDYLQHGYSRRCKVVCESGTITWDFTLGKIGIITVSNPRWVWKDMQLELSYNQMYLDEVKYFMDCVAARKNTFNTVRQALPVLKLALQANRSCSTNAWERMEEN
jgi:predicted dehydrogenase